MTREYDKLTGIFNFTTFLSETRKLLDTNPEEEYLVLVFDIERFKVINEMFSMEMGDEVLKNVAVTFSQYVTKNCGTYGRIGSDRFVCCIPKKSYDETTIKEYLSFDISSDNKSYRVYMQAGIYFISDRNIDVIKMCDRALMALKSIKGHFSEKIAFFSENERFNLVETQQLISDLDRGIKNKEFKIVIQPVYRIKDNIMVSGEVLVRWQHPTLGLLMPGKFVPTFEKNYVINQLDKYVWEEACILIRRMMDTMDIVIPLSINVSRVDLLLEDVVKVLEDLVNKYDIPHKYLRIEITESAYMDSPQKLIDTIVALKDKGFIILMDDFGAGYSSLNTLMDLSFDVLKIDKKLIDEIDNSQKAGSVVVSIIRMARWLGMKVVAEGIEKCSQANLLRNIGCDYLQGYLYSKPVDVDVFLDKKGEVVTIANMQIKNTLSLDNVFATKDLYTRMFFEELTGPLAMFELEGDDFRFVEANEQFSRKYEVDAEKLIAQYDLENKGLIGKTRTKLIDKCKEAYVSKSPEHLTITKRISESERQWINIKIIYVGDRDNAKAFVFGITDVTRSTIEHNRKETMELYPLLCTMFTEILEFDYTYNTLTTLYKNDSKINAKHMSMPLDDMLDRLCEHMITPEYVDDVKKYFSKEFVDNFVNGDQKFFTFKLDMYDRERIAHPCEMTIIRKTTDASRLSVMVCTRVL